MKRDNVMKGILLIVSIVFLTLFSCNKTSLQANKVIEIYSPITSVDEQINPKQSVRKFVIAIDPGHQAKGNYELEPIGPGSSESKSKVASGTRGVLTKIPEYRLTLEVSLKLREELLARGYNVFMIRETNDVNISNRERAVMATEAGADIFVRIHADGSGDSSVNGILTMCPTSRNPYIPQLYTQSRALSDDILTAMVSVTDAKKRGVLEVDNMSGINWSTIPVTIVEMGLMTNPSEDLLMQTEEYQRKLVIGITDGIEQYFRRKEQFGNAWVSG